MRCLRGVAVLVSAEQADIEVKAGVFKVVGVAAVERNLLFGREHEADIRVFLIAVEVVLASLVERDHLAAQAGLLQRLLFNGGARGPAGLKGGFVRKTRGDRGIHARGDILDAHEHA